MVSMSSNLRVITKACALAAGMAAVGVATRAEDTAPKPRFPGAATSVAHERTSGKLAVAHEGKLDIYDSWQATKPAAELVLPASNAQVLEFRGNTIHYSFAAEGQPRQDVAVRPDGRDILVWPNDGISDLFPHSACRLTRDGKGVIGTVQLDARSRELFSTPPSIPDGATVVATYKFAGGVLAGRASDGFRTAIGLTTQDLVIVQREGGVMRYTSPTGVAWKAKGMEGKKWALADVDAGAGIVLAIDDQRSIAAVDLGSGAERGRWTAPGDAVIGDARWMRNGVVLVLVVKPEKSLLAVDPASGKAIEPALVDTLNQRGLAGVYSAWLQQAVALSGLIEVPLEAGTGWLIRGADGWYAAEP